MRQYRCMTRLPSVLSFDDLPEAELNAAVLDGELYRIEECFSAIDEIENPVHRARALAVQYSDRLIAEQFTAAWIFGALERAPRAHQFCTMIDSRVRLSRLQPITVREVVISSSEIVTSAGLSLTTPLRTILDIARFSPRFDLQEQKVVVNLLKLGDISVSECARALAVRRNLPQKRQALRRIAEAALSLR